MYFNPINNFRDEQFEGKQLIEVSSLVIQNTLGRQVELK